MTEPDGIEESITVGDVTIRAVLSREAGRWRAVYWREGTAVSCSDHPWHPPLPQGPHTEDRAVVHVRHHARWLCVQYGATPGPPPNMSLLAMRLSHPERALSRMRTSSEALAAVERRAAAEAPERERREAVAMHREAERQQRVAMADGRDDQYMRDLHWSVFRSCLIPQEGKDSHGRE